MPSKRVVILLFAILMSSMNCNRDRSFVGLDKFFEKIFMRQQSNSNAGQANGQTPAEIYAFNTCLHDCPAREEYLPVCGSDGVTYFNRGKLACANECGKTVTLAFTTRCENVNATQSGTSSGSGGSSGGSSGGNGGGSSGGSSGGGSNAKRRPFGKRRFRSSHLDE